MISRFSDTPAPSLTVRTVITARSTNKVFIEEGGKQNKGSDPFWPRTGFFPFMGNGRERESRAECPEQGRAIDRACCFVQSMESDLEVSQSGGRGMGGFGARSHGVVRECGNPLALMMRSTFRWYSSLNWRSGSMKRSGLYPPLELQKRHD